MPENNLQRTDLFIVVHTASSGLTSVQSKPMNITEASIAAEKMNKFYGRDKPYGIARLYFEKE